MAEQSTQLVKKLWNYCNILRDDGLSYGDHASAWLSTGSEPLTFLLFLKMADERSQAPFNKPSPIPKNVDWQTPKRLDGDELETHYRHVLESLGREMGMLGVIAVNLENPPEGSKIRLTVSACDESWRKMKNYRSLRTRHFLLMTLSPERWCRILAG